MTLDLTSVSTADLTTIINAVIAFSLPVALSITFVRKGISFLFGMIGRA